MVCFETPTPVLFRRIKLNDSYGGDMKNVHKNWSQKQNARECWPFHCVLLACSVDYKWTKILKRVAWIILEKHSIFQSTITSVCFRKQYFQVYVLQKNEAKYALNEFAYSIRIAENILYPEYFRVSSFGRTFGVRGVKLTILLQHPEVHTPATVSQRCHSGDNINILKNTYWMSMVPPRAAAWSMGI